MFLFQLILSFLLIVFNISSNSVFCLNILFYVPTLSHSHISFNSKLAETLSNYGHSVTILLSLVDDTLTIPTFNSTSSIPKYKVLQKRVGVPRGHLRQVLWSNPGPYEDSSPLNPQIFFKLLTVSQTFVSACESIAGDETFLNDLKTENFDVGLVEQYDLCGFGIFKAIGIDSTVWLSATAIYRPQAESMGVHLPYSYVPELFAHNGDEMSFIQTIFNVLIGYTTSIVSNFIAQARQSYVFRKFGYISETDDLMKISAESSSLLINSAPFFDYSMPMSHQFSNIGGFTVDTNDRNLDVYWKSIADDAINGFILVSFGGIARTVDMTRNMQQIFFSSFSRFPHITFIVKYESTNATVFIPENVILTQWIPQLPLMAHENYKSIITHGGWSSILETTIHSRPMILMPLFADHAKNSKVAESKGVAVLLDKMSISKRKVIDAIRRVLTDQSFTQNCEKFSRMLSDLPTSNENMIDWRVRQASKKTRKRFAKHLKPKEYTKNYVFQLLFITVSVVTLFTKFIKISKRFIVFL